MSTRFTELGSDSTVRHGGQIRIVAPMSMGLEWNNAPLITRAVAVDIYRHNAGRYCDEVYLRGTSLLEAAGLGSYYQEHERPTLIAALLDMDRRGFLESRGPQAWAIRLFDEFRWKAGVPPKREELFARDGWACWYCGQRVCLESGHADHYFPRSRGGWDDAANLVASCRKCNCSKGALTHGEWSAREYEKWHRENGARG